MKSEDVLWKLLRKYGPRRAMVLFGAAAVAAQSGWDTLVGDEAYTRQGVWTWKRDLEAAGIDPFAIEWTGFERDLGAGLGMGLAKGTARRRAKAVAASARKSGKRAST